MFLIGRIPETTREVAARRALNLACGIRCGKCNLKRFYKPLELWAMISNVTIDEIVRESAAINAAVMPPSAESRIAST
ncbi:hypothetical protein QV13_06860 [Mesorhizobium hungaricum]|jgi:hypothetical protein|uniref:Uncharacterized protein n=1 Tax=Mesorhizobium hungaricum TaxID=1566387 RepID=A0A1C2E2Y4_9HYPH|nr:MULTISPECIES: hypothetical protein [Mesorhizobium]MBN9235706.1 hypothetical protein [Mesorhizobium sp.]MDQ0332955.1 hypothetical protein [Mesorhizobium sp. YL-MeA3-2017]OCX21380.1 hypothetical protein QV13_06860 [Mesorhizobium hungaricum]